jgi:hypothetical protein
MARSVPFVSLLFLAPVAGCRLPFGEACSTVFANVQLVVLDTTGTPLSGLTIVDTVLRTHRSFTVNQGPYWSGSYDVFDDGDKGVIRSGGDAVRVTGSGSAKFSAAFMFSADACHVGKVSGPDTVVAR